MTKIDTSLWKEFRIGGDQGLFEIVKGKRLTKANMLVGTTNFIGSSADNNGITNQISNRENLHPGNLITVAYNGSVGETFYQEEEFVASDDVNVLYPKFDLNKYIALFLCPIIKSVGKKYVFIDKWKKEDMEKDSIYLPVDENGTPDWKYMENYMRKLDSSIKDTIERLNTTDDIKIAKIDISSWKEFPITNYFELSLPKGDLQVKKVQSGDVPLITPSNTNNGVQLRISSKSKSTLYKANALTVDMFGNAYYQEEEFFVTSHGHVNVLKPKMNLNKYIGWFIASTIKNMFHSRYGFSDMCTLKVLKKETILLPVDENGEPDWQSMEEYMKSVEEKSKKKIEMLVM